MGGGGWMGKLLGKKEGGRRMGQERRGRSFIPSGVGDRRSFPCDGVSWGGGVADKKGGGGGEKTMILNACKVRNIKEGGWHNVAYVRKTHCETTKKTAAT